MNSDKVLKDLNYVEIQSDLKKQLFECPFSFKEDILDVLSKDSMFLRRHNIMDYSLLLAIEENTGPYASMTTNFSNKYETRNKLGNYHIGIIDWLQQFTFQKKSEMCWKSSVQGKNKLLLSSVPPDFYQARFMKFMRDNVFAREKDDYENMLL